MPITLKKQAFRLPERKISTLTDAQITRLYQDPKTPLAYEYPNPAQQKNYQYQMIQLCEHLKGLMRDPALALSPNESRENSSLAQDYTQTLRTYQATITNFQSNLLYLGNPNASYAVKANNPTLFAEIKYNLEIMILHLYEQIEKFKMPPYEMTEKLAAARMLCDLMTQIKVCPDGAHEKLTSIKEQIEKANGLKDLIAQQLEGVFVKLGSMHYVEARNRIMNTGGSDTHDLIHILNTMTVHIPNFFKMAAYDLNIIAQDQKQVSDVFVPKYGIDNGGVIVESRNNACQLDESISNCVLNRFPMIIEQDFNAQTVIENLRNYLLENVHDIQKKYMSSNKSNKTDTMLHERQILMSDFGLENMAGFFEFLDDDNQLVLKDKQERVYWAHVMSCQALEKMDLIEGVRRQDLNENMWLVGNGNKKWIENSNHELIDPANIPNDQWEDLAKSLERKNLGYGLNHVLLNALERCEPDDSLSEEKLFELKKNFKTRESACKRAENDRAIIKDHVTVVIENIEDVIALYDTAYMHNKIPSFMRKLRDMDRDILKQILSESIKNPNTREKAIEILDTMQAVFEGFSEVQKKKYSGVSIYLNQDFKDWFTLHSSELGPKDIPEGWLGEPPHLIPKRWIGGAINIQSSKDFLFSNDVMKKYVQGLNVGHRTRGMNKVLSFIKEQLASNHENGMSLYLEVCDDLLNLVNDLNHLLSIKLPEQILQDFLSKLKIQFNIDDAAIRDAFPPDSGSMKMVIKDEQKINKISKILGTFLKLETLEDLEFACRYQINYLVDFLKVNHEKITALLADALLTGDESHVERAKIIVDYIEPDPDTNPLNTADTYCGESFMSLLESNYPDNSENFMARVPNAWVAKIPIRVLHRHYSDYKSIQALALKYLKGNSQLASRAFSETIFPNLLIPYLSDLKNETDKRNFESAIRFIFTDHVLASRTSLENDESVNAFQLALIGLMNTPERLFYIIRHTSDFSGEVQHCLRNVLNNDQFLDVVLSYIDSDMTPPPPHSLTLCLLQPSSIEKNYQKYLNNKYLMSYLSQTYNWKSRSDFCACLSKLSDEQLSALNCALPSESLQISFMTLLLGHSTLQKRIVSLISPADIMLAIANQLLSPAIALKDIKWSSDDIKWLDQWLESSASSDMIQMFYNEISKLSKINFEKVTSVDGIFFAKEHDVLERNTQNYKQYDFSSDFNRDNPVHRAVLIAFIMSRSTQPPCEQFQKISKFSINEMVYYHEPEDQLVCIRSYDPTSMQRSVVDHDESARNMSGLTFETASELKDTFFGDKFTDAPTVFAQYFDNSALRARARVHLKRLMTERVPPARADVLRKKIAHYLSTSPSASKYKNVLAILPEGIPLYNEILNYHDTLNLLNKKATLITDQNKLADFLKFACELSRPDLSLAAVRNIIASLPEHPDQVFKDSVTAFFAKHMGGFLKNDKNDFKSIYFILHKYNAQSKSLPDIIKLCQLDSSSLVSEHVYLPFLLSIVTPDNLGEILNELNPNYWLPFLRALRLVDDALDITPFTWLSNKALIEGTLVGIDRAYYARVQIVDRVKQMTGKQNTPKLIQLAQAASKTHALSPDEIKRSLIEHFENLYNSKPVDQRLTYAITHPQNNKP